MSRFLKKTVPIILVLSLLMQSVPAPAQAFSITKFFNKLFRKIKIPEEIKITDKGDVKLGNLRLLKCIQTNEERECVNPFSTIKLGKDQVELRDKLGRLKVPRAKIPKDCEIRIVSPESEGYEKLTEKEQTSLFKACSHINNIQKNASLQVLAAKKIFNNTDPLSKCLFLRNCKSSCKLRLGEVSYTINVVDVAIMIAGPIGIANTIRKIADLAVKINELVKVIEQFSTLVQSFISFANDILKQVSYISAFLASFREFLQIDPSELQKLLKEFSDNLLLFGQTKSAIFSLISKNQEKIEVIENILKQMEGVKFLFAEDKDSQEKRKELEEIITSFTVKIESFNSLIFRLEQERKSVKDLFDKKSGRVECPPEPSSPCRINSPLPEGCFIAEKEERETESGSKVEDDALIKCQAGTYNIDISPSVADRVGCRDLGDRRVQCPKAECRLDYPRVFGSHTLSCSNAIKNSLSVSCPTVCSISCAYPYNDWFVSFKDFVEEVKSVKKNLEEYHSCLLVYKTLDNFNKYLEKCFPKLETVENSFSATVPLQERLRQESAVIPALSLSEEEKEAGLIETKQYWTSTENKISVNYPIAAETWGENNCSFNYELSRLLWENKINNITASNITGRVKDLNTVVRTLKLTPPAEAKRILDSFASAPEPNFRLTALANSLQASSQKTKKEVEQIISHIEKMISVFRSLHKTLIETEVKKASDYLKNAVEIKKGCQDILTSVEEIESLCQQASESYKIESLENIKQIILTDIRTTASTTLQSITSFEEKIGLLLEDIITPLLVIEDMEKGKEDLKEVKEEVELITPSIKIEPLQIKTQSGSPWDLKFNKGNISLSDIAANPLSQIEEHFDNIDSLLIEIHDRFNEDLSLLESITDEKVKETTQDKIKKLQNSLRALGSQISGGEEVTNACELISFFDFSSPAQIEKNCEELDESPLLKDEELKEKCSILEYLQDFLLNTPLRMSDLKTRTENGESLKKIWFEEICGSEPSLGLKGFEEYVSWSNCMAAAETGVISENRLSWLADNDFAEQCSLLATQEELLEQCNFYRSVIKRAVNNSCLLSKTPMLCGEARESFLALKKYCPGWIKAAPGRSAIPDILTDQNEGDSEFQNTELEEARKVCREKLLDLRAPLRKIMKVFSILLGIKSGVGIYKGIKTMKQHVKKMIENAQKVKTLIKELPKSLKKNYVPGGGGLDIEAIKCVSQPAFGYRNENGPKGGRVCPYVKESFSAINSSFSFIRQSLFKLYMLTKEKKYWKAKVGPLNFKLFKTYPKYNNGKGAYYEKVVKLYKKAKGIKERSQNLWVAAVAVDFAAQNCTCGQSFCKMPLCISGAPLTLEPIGNPYCWLVYILRYPLLKQAEVLENYLK